MRRSKQKSILIYLALTTISEPGVRVRAERVYQQLDGLQPGRLEARRQLLLESHKHAAVKLLRQIPSIGPIRAAPLVALLQTPHRFRTRRQLWTYSGFTVETRDSWGVPLRQRHEALHSYSGIPEKLGDISVRLAYRPKSSLAATSVL